MKSTDGASPALHEKVTCIAHLTHFCFVGNPIAACARDRLQPLRDNVLSSAASLILSRPRSASLRDWRRPVEVTVQILRRRVRLHFAVKVRASCDVRDVDEPQRQLSSSGAKRSQIMRRQIRRARARSGTYAVVHRDDARIAAMPVPETHRLTAHRRARLSKGHSSLALERIGRRGKRRPVFAVEREPASELALAAGGDDGLRQAAGKTVTANWWRRRRHRSESFVSFSRGSGRPVTPFQDIGSEAAVKPQIWHPEAAKSATGRPNDRRAAVRV